MLSKSITKVDDPGHGWLRVPLTDLVILEAKKAFTDFSMAEGIYAYLEEDEDAGRYLDIRQKAGHARPNITHKYVDYFDRGKSSINSDHVQNFLAGLRGAK